MKHSSINLALVLFECYISHQIVFMTDILITEQVKIIEKATKTASQSKESAVKFLEEAGIIKKQNSHLTTPNGNSYSKKKK